MISVKTLRCCHCSYPSQHDKATLWVDRHKKLHLVRLHFYELSRTNKSAETKSKLAPACGCEGRKAWEYPLMCRGLLLGWGNDPKWILVMTARLEYTSGKKHQILSFQWLVCIVHGLFLKKDMVQGTGLMPKETACATF